MHIVCKLYKYIEILRQFHNFQTTFNLFDIGEVVGFYMKNMLLYYGL